MSDQISSDQTSRRPSGRETIIVLADEIKATGLPPASRDLIAALDDIVEPILVAQSYLKPSHRARRLPCRHELYGFAAEGYKRSVKAFAAEIAARHAPAWVLACGWENAQLIVELDRLDIPIILFVEDIRLEAEGQLTRAFLCAEKILFADAAIPRALTPTGLWGLQSRAHEVLNVPSDPAGSAPPRAWSRLFGRRPDAPSRRELAKHLVDIGTRAAARRREALVQRRRDEAVITASGLFNSELFLPLQGEEDDPTAPVVGYLRASGHAVPRDRTFAGRMLRRPLEGFHPLIYASDNPDFDETSDEDPFAHYLRQGRPKGRWAHEIIRDRPANGPTGGIRTALHAHMHYTDLLPELLDRLRVNQTQANLFITTSSDGRRDDIITILADAGVAPTCVTADSANRGRDIWPFLDLLGSGAFAGYDVVGHVHGKRSPTYELGDVWRDFLWRHLIGGPETMMDAVVARFAEDGNLGLVIPEDPHLEGWEEDLALGTELAAKMGIPLPLPNHFDYPMGTMFWARPAALAPLLDLGLTAEMMPAEPLPEDGTILHALERLIPFAATKAGFRAAATYVPGSRR